MILTPEQKDIINSTGNIKINAVAGSGKTTTIIEYARTRPLSSKILYLAFNKSVKIEAVKRFAEAGLTNVKVETAHSLAYRHIVFQNNYVVRPSGYKTHEIAELLGLKGNGEKHAEFMVANHISKFIAYFCNSDKLKVQELNYREVVTDAKARKFVDSFYDIIEAQTRQLLSKMDKGEIDITHDFYLKKFQLSGIQLSYDYILFDEGQDASAAMLDLFFRQSATKVIVGDTHQQIYGWRFAVNSLEKADFKTFNLSQSFRFSQDIANLAMEILYWKNHLGSFNPVKISGMGTTKSVKSKAILARTNLGLLLKAIEYVTESSKVKSIYFEGNINSYTYADDGASLYDVLHLSSGKNTLIRDKLIKEMKDMAELEEYIEKTEDVQLGMMVDIVKEYGKDIPDILKKIKAKHVGDEDKDKAEMIFSTVHRCKGMEYDSVQLVSDFITEEKLEKLIKTVSEEELNPAKLNEEINLLYVAVTRTKNSIHLGEGLMPKNFPVSPQIHILKNEAEVKAEKPVEFKSFPKPLRRKFTEEPPKERSYSVEKVRENFQEAYKPWSPEMDSELTVMFCEGVNVKDLAKHFGRTKNAIRKRIEKLELEDLYGA